MWLVGWEYRWWTIVSRIPFSRKWTISTTHKSQKYLYTIDKKISFNFNMTLALTNLDLDRSDPDFDPETVILKFHQDRQTYLKLLPTWMIIMYTNLHAQLMLHERYHHTVLIKWSGITWTFLKQDSYWWDG